MKRFSHPGSRASAAGLLAAILPAFGFSQEASIVSSDEGRPVAHHIHADQVIGRTAFVCGKVLEVGAGSRTFLNFDATRPGHFTVVIRSEHLDRFPEDPAKLYKGRIVKVRGIVKTYRGRPEIEVSQPAAIEILEKLPPERLLSQAPRTGVRELTVATSNVLNLFDDLDDPTHTDEGTPPKPRDEMRKLAEVLRGLDADVIALQEVENREILERFVEVYLWDMGYRAVHFEGNDIRGIDVCLLSRVPIGDVRSHRHLVFKDAKGAPSRFRRDLLSVTVEPVGGKPIELWVVHLQSNYEGREFAEPVRVGEATKIRELLDRRFAAEPNACLLVLGDFNDTWDSATLRRLRGDGTGAMRCFAEEVSAEKRITYNKEPYRSMIDFILCSPAMASVYVKGSYRIRDGSVQTIGTDHNPVVARFRVE